MNIQKKIGFISKRSHKVKNKIREPDNWRHICSFYIKSNNISDLGLFQGLIYALVCQNWSSHSHVMVTERAT